MTIDARCIVCKNPDRRRWVELGWNGGMTSESMARVLDQKGLSTAVLARHLKEHADGDTRARAVVVEPLTPARERVLNLQRMQLDEVERRITLAKQKADMLNVAQEELVARGMQGSESWTPHDWSEFFDILDKDAQAAISSILKTQGLTDKREKAVADTKLGLFEAMAKNGLAPKAISGPIQLPALPSGEEDDNDDDA